MKNSDFFKTKGVPRKYKKMIALMNMSDTSTAKVQRQLFKNAHAAHVAAKMKRNKDEVKEGIRVDAAE